MGDLDAKYVLKGMKKPSLTSKKKVPAGSKKTKKVQTKSQVAKTRKRNKDGTFVAKSAK